MPKLEQPLRRRQVFQAMLAQIADRLRESLHQRPCRRREHHLTAVRSCRDARRTMHIKTHIAVTRQQRRPRVDPNPHSNPPVGQNTLDLESGTQRVVRPRKRHKTSIPFEINNPSPVRGASLLDDPPLKSKRPRPLNLAQFPHEPRRPLHIREEERHRPRRQLPARHLTRIADANALGHACGNDAVSVVELIGALGHDEERQAECRSRHCCPSQRRGLRNCPLVLLRVLGRIGAAEELPRLAVGVDPDLPRLRIFGDIRVGIRRRQ